MSLCPHFGFAFVFFPLNLGVVSEKQYAGFHLDIKDMKEMHNGY